MFKRNLDSEPTAAKVKENDVVVDHLAITIVRHTVDVHNVNVQWFATRLEQSLSDTPLGTNPNFYIDGLALSHGLLLFRKDSVRRGIIVIEICQDDKSVPSYHEMKPSGMSVEIKFKVYNTSPHLEVDLLSHILLLRNDILRRNKILLMKVILLKVVDIDFQNTVIPYCHRAPLKRKTKHIMALDAISITHAFTYFRTYILYRP